MKLDRDFSEFIASCAARDVRFLVVGGYALAVHGHPRFTKDLGVWVWVSHDNADRLIQALGDFGFGSLGLRPEDFRTAGRVVQLGRAPKRIDILTSADGVSFDECWDRRITVRIDELDVPFISLEDLITNKRASGRPQDLAEIAALEG
jgi:hypothetical protein